MVYLCPRRSRGSGFTLVEILVALAVTSVGITVFLSLYSSSVNLAQTSRNQSVAASLAEEQLQALRQHPGAFQWPEPDAAAGTLVEVTAKDTSDPEWRSFKPPSVLPTNPRQSAREKDVYSAFSWQAFATNSAANPGQLDLTVVVRWTEAGRPRLLALTTAILRSEILLARAEGSS